MVRHRRESNPHQQAVLVLNCNQSAWLNCDVMNESTLVSDISWSSLKILWTKGFNHGNKKKRIWLFNAVKLTVNVNLSIHSKWVQSFQKLQVPNQQEDRKPNQTDGRKWVREQKNPVTNHHLWKRRDDRNFSGLLSFMKSCKWVMDLKMKNLISWCSLMPCQLNSFWMIEDIPQLLLHIYRKLNRFLNSFRHADWRDADRLLAWFSPLTVELNLFMLDSGVCPQLNAVKPLGVNRTFEWVYGGEFVVQTEASFCVHSAAAPSMHWGAVVTEPLHCSKCCKCGGGTVGV